MSILLDVQPLIPEKLDTHIHLKKTAQRQNVSCLTSSTSLIFVNMLIFYFISWDGATRDHVH